MASPQSQYDPGFTAFGGGATSSVLHPAVLVALFVAAALTFVLPRKYVLVPLLLGILLIPAGQNLYIGGVHFYIYRILILLGWVRLLSSRESSWRLLPGGFSTLDKVFLVWAVYRALAVLLLFAQVSAVTNQVAFLLDSLGGYFLFRSLIRDDRDVRRVVKVFAVVAAVSAVLMLIELKTGRNLFGFMGGIRLISDVRNGRIRAQGVFQHSILAGSFGATIFPLFLWLWRRGGAGSLRSSVAFHPALWFSLAQAAHPSRPGSGVSSQSACGQSVRTCDWFAGESSLVWCFYSW